MKYDPLNERNYSPKSCNSYEDGKYIPYQYGITVISDRVIRKQAYTSTRSGFEAIEAVCRHFMRHPNPLVVPVYDFQAEHIPFSRWGAHRYHYDMMRMGILTEDEKHFIRRVADKWCWDNLDPNRELYFNQFRGTNDKLLLFIKQILMEGRYNDFHIGNIMKDEDEQFRLVDLEGFGKDLTLTDPANAWLFE